LGGIGQESFSKAIPPAHRCNTCKAIIFQLNDRFRQLGRRKLKTWEIEEVYSRVCEAKDSLWQNYGARDIDGEPALTGPGLLDPKPEKGKMVVTSRGGPWADRLQMACLQMVDELGEEELYTLYTRGGTYEGSDEYDICVRRRHLCQSQELDQINTRIAMQAKKDAGKKVYGSTTPKPKRVVKPVVDAQSAPGAAAGGEEATGGGGAAGGSTAAAAAATALGRSAQEDRERKERQRREASLREEIREVVEDLASETALVKVLRFAQELLADNSPERKVPRNEM